MTIIIITMNRSIITLIAILLYLLGTFYSLHLSSKPLYPCPKEIHNTSSSRCLTPLVSLQEQLILDLFILTIQETKPHIENDANNDAFYWKKVESCSSFDISLQEQSAIRLEGSNCTIAIPSWARQRRSLPKNTSSVAPLKAKFILRKSHPTNNLHTDQVAEATFDLTRFIEMVDPIKSSSTLPSSSLPKQNIPFYKYGKQPIVLRYVADDQIYGSVHRSDGVILKRHLYQNRYTTFHYKPLFYADDNALLHQHQSLLAPPISSSSSTTTTTTTTSTSHVEKSQTNAPKPPVTLSIKFSIISPERDVIHNLMTEGMKVVESILSPTELDDIRFFFTR